jgi:tetratricopeptide (TPR) repeat protein
MSSPANDVTNPDAWLNAGNVLYLQGNYAGAIKAYDRALALSPGFTTANTNKGIAVRKLEGPKKPAPAPPAPAPSQPTGGFLQKLKEWLNI